MKLSVIKNPAAHKARLDRIFAENRREGVEPDWSTCPDGAIGAVINRGRNWHVFFKRIKTVRVGLVDSLAIITTDDHELHFVADACQWMGRP